MKMTNKKNKFSAEVRERAVRLVQEHRGEYPSLWTAVESIAAKIVLARMAVFGLRHRCLRQTHCRLACEQRDAHGLSCSMH